MKYHISYQNFETSFLDLELLVENIDSDQIFLQLPAWRPGRYELQNFAKNIQRFQIFDTDNQVVSFKKVTKDCWEAQTKGLKKIRIIYNYYARQFDAGGSVLKEDLVYINFVNCCMYVVGRIDENYEIDLDIPDNFKIACGLKKDKNTLFAKNFYELVDAPLLASPTLQLIDYEVDSVKFYIWFYGNLQTNLQKIASDFKKITIEQIKLFGEFPELEYNFLCIVPSVNFYHGVEHFNSTVIVLGSDENFESLYESDFLGISSHELFHAWNIIKIRPIELMPYDFTKENYFRTGYIVEGITTYYGDYLLCRSGVWSLELYFKEFAILMKRHFSNGANAFLSLSDSSFDLWLDGYVAGIPNRKSSIYQKGALVAFLLDIEIRKQTKNKCSLDDVMIALWQEFGKKKIGYNEYNYKQLCELISGVKLNQYFEKFINGTEALEPHLQEAFDYLGCDLEISISENHYQINLKENINPQEKENLKKWIGQKQVISK